MYLFEQYEITVNRLHKCMRKIFRKIGRGVNKIASKLDPDRDTKIALDNAHKEIMEDLDNFVVTSNSKMDRAAKQTIKRMENIVENQN